MKEIRGNKLINKLRWKRKKEIKQTYKSKWIRQKEIK